MPRHCSFHSPPPKNQISSKSMFIHYMSICQHVHNRTHLHSSPRGGGCGVYPPPAGPGGPLGPPYGAATMGTYPPPPPPCIGAIPCIPPCPPVGIPYGVVINTGRGPTPPGAAIMCMPPGPGRYPIIMGPPGPCVAIPKGTIPAGMCAMCIPPVGGDRANAPPGGVCVWPWPCAWWWGGGCWGGPPSMAG